MPGRLDRFRRRDPRLHEDNRLSEDHPAPVSDVDRVARTEERLARAQERLSRAQEKVARAAERLSEAEERRSGRPRRSTRREEAVRPFTGAVPERRTGWGTAALGLIGWLLLAAADGTIGAIASVPAPAFYNSLVRPDWAPPSYLFGPVWTALYVLMAVAAWLVWLRSGQRGVRGALTLFVIQLVFNALWSWIFFRWRMGGLALLDLGLLWVFLLAATIAFWRIRPIAGALLLPYLAWVTYAGALNAAVWRLNPTLL